MPLTSLIPAVIALSQFFIYNFPHIAWYPYWYLGNPYYYLIGPVVPLLLSVLYPVPVPLFFAYIFLIITAVAITGLGIYLLLRSYGYSGKVSFASGILYMFFPAIYGILFYQNGLKHIALAFLPLLLLAYKRYLKQHTIKYAFLCSGIIAVILLTNAASLLTIVIGILALVLSNTKHRKTGEIYLRMVLVIALGIAMATFWYTPGFWWTVLTNPSTGGIRLFKLAGNILQGLFQLLPLLLAFLMVKWRGRKLREFHIFVLLFFSGFAVLTGIRFLLDPDFIMDWTGFIPELQFGLALMVGLFSGRLIRRKGFLISGVIIVLLLDCSIVIINTPNIKEALMGVNNRTIEQCNNEERCYKSTITDLITKHVPKTDRVFLSGSPVFWINAYTDIPQVRGNNDTVSIHPWWAHGAYQIREGEDGELTNAWLRIFGASYLLLNDTASVEPFHDFKNTAKYSGQKAIRLVGKKNGNYLYNIKGASIGRIASVKILNIPGPENGADKKPILSYAASLKRPLELIFIRPDLIKISPVTLNAGEVISLAIPYDSHWQLSGRGRLRSDSLGNSIIIPEASTIQEFTLSYSYSNTDLAIPCAMSLIFGLGIVYFRQILPYLQRITDKFSFGVHEQEDDY